MLALVSGSRTGRGTVSAKSSESPNQDDRLRQVESAIDALRATVAGLEREIGLVRADLERLRVEAQRAAGTKLP
jgi:hypothetical protein